MITTTTPIPSGPSSVGVSANVSDALSGLGSKIPTVQWCISADGSRNWSSPMPLTSAGGSTWAASIPQNGAQASGDTFYYQVTAQDVAGNSATVGSSATMTYSGGGLPVGVPFWADLVLVALAVILFAKFVPKKRASPAGS